MAVALPMTALQPHLPAGAGALGDGSLWPWQELSVALAELPGYLALLAIGRLLLSFLPAGSPGSHRSPGIAATWAASQLLGMLTLCAQLSLYAQLGFSPGAPAILLPWLALALLRLTLLPGRPLPRHEPATQRPGPLALMLGLASLLPAASLILSPECFPAPPPDAAIGSWRVVLQDRCLFLTPGREASLLLPALCWLAASALVVHGLERARRAPTQARTLGLACACVPLYFESARALDVSAAALSFAAALATLPGWLRRADRRAQALCVVASAGAVLLTPRGLAPALVGLVALVLGGPPVALRGSLWRGLPVLAAAILLSDLPFGPWMDASFGQAELALLVGALLLAGSSWIRQPHPAEPLPERPERRALTLGAGLGSLSGVLIGQPLVVVPGLIACLGVLLLRPDQNSRGTRG